MSYPRQIISPHGERKADALNLDDVTEEIRTILASLPKLNVPPWGSERIAAPAALVTLPEQISYQGTYGRGIDQYERLQVLVLVSSPYMPQAKTNLAPFVAGAGPQSVAKAIEDHEFTSADDVTVTTAEFEVVTFAGTPYLAAIFTLEAVGPGDPE